ncbi:hypothetical protein Nepgr_026120 [Nepenthes gracilis]|uniref:Protein kinase domain-containing protein n=1 Tax=Nepenthes gracilis TaxID=150966 RepID=A0AAD3T7N4_NEPGR|nr:hypothetical protein Nepgr_026120 [Nepenthes gracilis]
MKMESSSETGWRKSKSTRALDTTTSSDVNLGLLRAGRISSSTDGSRDSAFETAAQVRDNAGNAPSDHFGDRVLGSAVSDAEIALDPFACSIQWGDVSLRQWLDDPERAIDAIECLHIFRQIVEIVHAAHSQGIVISNIRPSCFVMSSFNHVSFIESASCSDSGSDSLEDGMKVQSRETTIGHNWKSEPETLASGQGAHVPFVEESSECEMTDSRSHEKEDGKKQSFPMKNLLLRESSWYTSTEEIAGAPSSCASDVYQLGVLLFELFCTFSSTEEKSRTMSSLRHRVLPPQILLKWPKVASLCLWLLHPDPSSRPKMSELLQSKFVNEARPDIEEREAAIELREKIEEQELLLEFLVLARQTKQEASDKLHDTISLLSSDIEEILNLQRAVQNKSVSSSEHDEFHSSMSDLPQLNNLEREEVTSLGPRKRLRPGSQNPNAAVNFDYCSSERLISMMGVRNQENLQSNYSRLMKNFKKFESAYLSTRRRPSKPSAKQPAGHSWISSNSKGSVVSTEKSVNKSLSKEGDSKDQEGGWVSPFLEGLCKYLSFTKLRVKADLKQGDLLNSSNLVCSVSCDRDGDFFAVGGVNKKIKVFECEALLNEDRDIHYPIVEMSSRSKLSSVCWNSYIKSQIASSNFEGIVQVWDVARGQVFMELKEHERRVWSVDFSSADPTILASGSDDGSVKLWSINQGGSISTIKAKANVCCVQFPLDSGQTLSFGSADHKVYYYDLRNPKIPLCTLIGHDKTVSYVKFIDATNVVSASTDNTLKLWDLSLSRSRILESPVQSFTGHTNLKNFVGLSVSDGYIATGSETNEVFIYHKAFPMPAISFKFNSIDPITGRPVDDPMQYVSSVCWRGRSMTLVAGNSNGDIKLLEMV